MGYDQKVLRIGPEKKNNTWFKFGWPPTIGSSSWATQGGSQSYCYLDYSLEVLLCPLVYWVYWGPNFNARCASTQWLWPETQFTTSDEPPLKFGLFWNKFMFDLWVFWDPWLNNCRVHSTGSPNRTFNSPKTGPKMHKGLTLKEKILNLFLFPLMGRFPEN